MSISIHPVIARWQADKHEIGMIEFAPSEDAAKLFPHYKLPASAVFLGLMEADALCLSIDGSLRVYDHEVQDRIFCYAAKDQEGFVMAMKELEQHFKKCGADDAYCEDMDAATRVRDVCSQIAGGNDCVSFFSSLLGV